MHSSYKNGLNGMLGKWERVEFESPVAPWQEWARDGCHWDPQGLGLHRFSLLSLWWNLRDWDGETLSRTCHRQKGLSRENFLTNLKNIPPTLGMLLVFFMKSCSEGNWNLWIKAKDREREKTTVYKYKNVLLQISFTGGCVHNKSSPEKCKCWQCEDSALNPQNLRS